MIDPMEQFRNVCRPVKGALHTVVAHEDFLPLLDGHHSRWQVHSDLGVSLHAMRQLGHWRPFTRSSRRMFAELVVMGIEPATPEPQRSRRVGPPTTRSRPACASWLARLLMRGTDVRF